MFQKAIPESTVVRSQSAIASCPDESDDDKFEGFSPGEIENAEIQCKKGLDRCRRELAKVETCELIEDDDDEIYLTSMSHGKGMCLMCSSHKLIIMSISKNKLKCWMITKLLLYKTRIV